MDKRSFSEQLEGLHLQWFADEGTATTALTGDAGDATSTDPGVVKPDQETAETEPSGKVDGWAATLRPDQQQHELAKRFKKNPEIFDEYLKLNEKLQRSVAVPGEGATPEEWDEYYRKLGRPDSADEYELDGGEVVGEEFTKWFKQQAHATGMTKRQAESIYAKLQEFTTQQQEESLSATTRAREKALNTLKTEYGEDFDETIAGARRIIQKFGGEEFTQFLNEEVGGKKVGDDPRVIRTLMNIYKAVAEDKLLPGDVRGDRPRQPGEYRYPDMT
jgi:hypothetical protein